MEGSGTNINPFKNKIPLNTSNDLKIDFHINFKSISTIVDLGEERSPSLVWSIPADLSQPIRTPRSPVDSTTNMLSLNLSLSLSLSPLTPGSSSSRYPVVQTILGGRDHLYFLFLPEPYFNHLLQYPHTVH